MKTEDFIQIGSVKWGVWPYYDGDAYSENNILYVTSGAKSGLTYAQVSDGGYSFSSSDAAKQYLPIQSEDSQANSRFGVCYGGTMFARDILSSRDDLLRITDPTLAIPTSEELKKLLNNSDIYCTANGLVIDPKDSSVEVSITIPYNGVVCYKQEGSGVKADLGGIIQKPCGIDLSEIFEYSHIYLLTSDIVVDTDGNPTNKIRVVYIKVMAKFGPMPGPNQGNASIEDREFLEFELIEQPGKKIYTVQEIDALGGDGDSIGIKNASQGIGFMVLPIKYEGGFKINFDGQLYINDRKFINYNQELGDTIAPYFKFGNFSSPKVTEGKYYSIRNINSSDSNNINFNLSSTFQITNDVSRGINILIGRNIEYGYITNGAKIKSSANNGYWLLKKNPCLYLEPNDGPRDGLFMVVDTRSLITNTWLGVSGYNETTIYIDVNIDYDGGYTVPEDRFVLPSIYKPFYVKRVVSIAMGSDDYDDYVDYFYSSHTSVYNGIGMFAALGTGSNSTSGSTLPPDLTNTINSYFGGSETFSKNFGYFYDPSKSVYVIGLCEDTCRLSNVDKTLPFGEPLPIFRDKPLLLSDYNDSVFDYIEQESIEVHASYKYISTIYLDNYFTSALIPYDNMKLNRDIYEKIVVPFGNLFNKINVNLCIDGIGTPCITNPCEVASIINNGNNIRYYIVNQAFYNNYIFNAVNDGTKDIRYKEEYYNKREYYDLFPHEVDFRNGVWNDESAEGIYTPFFDMIPALRNTTQYMYSNGNNLPNKDAPLAFELYISNGYLTCHPDIANQCYTGGDSGDGLNRYGTMYLIGVDSPITRLNGSCMDEKSEYVKHVKYSTEILPQTDSTTVIFCYGTLDRKRCYNQQCID